MGGSILGTGGLTGWGGGGGGGKMKCITAMN